MLAGRGIDFKSIILSIIDVPFLLKDSVMSREVLLDLCLLLVKLVSRTVNPPPQLHLDRNLALYWQINDLATRHHASFTLTLEYCNMSYKGLPLKTLQKLQLVQNAAARFLSGVCLKNHVTPFCNPLSSCWLFSKSNSRHWRSPLKSLTIWGLLTWRMTFACTWAAVLSFLAGSPLPIDL